MYGKLLPPYLPNQPFLQNKILTDKLSSLDALIAALADLDKVCETIEDAYLNSLIEDKFERWEEQS